MPVLQNSYFIPQLFAQNDESCHVIISYVIPQIGKVDLKCNYLPDSLQLFTDEEALAVANGTTKHDKKHPDALQKIVDKECKRYIGGAL